jgi:hypothetical protein
MRSSNKYRFLQKHLGYGIETLFIRRENETRSGSGNMGRHERRAELSEFKRKVSRAGVVTYLVDASGRVTGRIGGRFEFMRRRNSAAQSRSTFCKPAPAACSVADHLWNHEAITVLCVGGSSNAPYRHCSKHSSLAHPMAALHRMRWANAARWCCARHTEYGPTHVSVSDL